MIRVLKSVIPTLTFAASLASASMAGAATYVLQNGAMDTPRTVSIAGIGSVKATPIQFDGYVDLVVDKPFTDLVAFCVDVYHHISLGTYSPALTYTDTIPLTTDSNFTTPIALTGAQITQVGKLVNYGTKVFYNAPQVTGAQKNARWDELAVIQSAIWEVASGKNVTFTGSATLDARVTLLSGASYLTGFSPSYGTISSDITLITPFKGSVTYPDRSLTQSFAFANVPEPATWAMMIGVLLRCYP